MTILNGLDRFDVSEGSLVRFIYNAKQRRVQVLSVNDTLDGDMGKRYFKGMETDSGDVKTFSINKIDGPILVLK